MFKWRMAFMGCLVAASGACTGEITDDQPSRKDKTAQAPAKPLVQTDWAREEKPAPGDPEFPLLDGGVAPTLPGHMNLPPPVAMLKPRDGGAEADRGGAEDAGTEPDRREEERPPICPPAECYCDAECDDGNVCTYDYCLHGSCVHDESRGGRRCDDRNPCTLDLCDSESGGCSHEPVADLTPCDDGDSATYCDHCHEGTCVGNLDDCAYPCP